MSDLRMAVVGVGALGRHHARILSTLDGVKLVAVADSSPERGEAVAKSTGSTWIADYRQLLKDDNLKVDAVSIAVPTVFHRTVAGEFLSAGIPVLVEKPLAANVKEAEELVALAEACNVPLQVGHIERFNPATTAAWSLCGKPKHIQASRVSPYSFRSTDIGVVHDLMIHDIDLVLDLVGSPVRDVQAFGVCVLGGHEDIAKASVTFEDGCVVDLTASRVNPRAGRSMEIWSPAGTTTVDFTSREVTHYRPSQTLLFGSAPLERAAQPGADIEQLKQDVFGTFLEVERPEVSDADALTAELASFVESITNGRTPVCDGKAALRAMQLADQILQSISAHQWDGNADGAIGPHPQFQPPRRMAG